jgi:hypothetical protein
MSTSPASMARSSVSPSKRLTAQQVRGDVLVAISVEQERIDRLLAVRGEKHLNVESNRELLDHPAECDDHVGV